MWLTSSEVGILLILIVMIWVVLMKALNLFE